MQLDLRHVAVLLDTGVKAIEAAYPHRAAGHAPVLHIAFTAMRDKTITLYMTGLRAGDEETTGKAFAPVLNAWTDAQ